MEEKTMRRNCRYSRLCKSTRRGTWIDCSLGKGLICMPNSKFCKYEPYKIKDIKEVIICECQSLKSDKDCDSSLEQQLQLKDNEIIRLQTLLDDYRTLGETNIKELKEELQLKENELNQLNQARDEICASGQPDYIGIIRNKNIELQLKDKMIELMAGEIREKILDKNYITVEQVAGGYHYKAQQALKGGEG